MKGTIAQISIFAARLCQLNQEKKESAFNSLQLIEIGGFFMSKLQTFITPLHAGIAPDIFRILWPQLAVVRVSGNSGYRSYSRR